MVWVCSLSGVSSTTSTSIGIVGGGQLAWMLAREARKLGVALHVQTPDPLDPATQEAASVVLGGLNDVAATRALAQRAGRISFENEWVALAELQQLEREGIAFLPSLSSLAPLITKRSQRQLLNDLNLPTPPWAPMEATLAPPPRQEGFGHSSAPEPSLKDGGYGFSPSVGAQPPPPAPAAGVVALSRDGQGEQRRV